MPRAEPKTIPIGMCRLHAEDMNLRQHHSAEIGIALARPYHNKGYGGEAIRWLLNWGFVHGNLHRIELRTGEFNTRADHLYRKLGFVFEGAKRQAVWFDGRYWDYYHYGMLVEEWKERYGKK
jgi:RimJ/RimL family protein N-acetyltransferase